MNSKNLKILLSILIILIITIFISGCKYKFNNDAKRFYKQGMDFYSEQKYQDAYYNFKQISRYSNLYSLALLKQFQCANYLQDKKIAHAKIKELVKYSSNTYIKPYALYNETILAEELEIDNKKRSLNKYNYIYKNFPNSDFAMASTYHIAKLTEDKNLSKEKYIEYVLYAPNGKYSSVSLDEIIKNNTALSQDDKTIMADSYFSNYKYSQAVELYKQTSFSKNWIKLSKCYKELNSKNEELNTIIKGLGLSKSDVEEKELSYAIDRLITISNANKIQTLQDLHTKYPHSYIAPTVEYKLAQNLSSIREVKLYEHIYKKYPDSYWASNSLWEVFWYNYRQSRYKICIELANEHFGLYPNSIDAPRMLYWKAKAQLKERKTLEAKDSFQKVRKYYPISYYSFMATKELKLSKAKKIIFKKPIDKYNITSINKMLFNDKSLLYLANYEDYQTIEELKIDNQYIKSLIIFKKENYPTSINIAKNEYFNVNDSNVEETKINFNDYRLKLIYPILYEEQINKYAHEFKQSPYLFLSLIREESHFNKNAKSSTGALGLSQIMPDTANFIEKNSISKETLITPDENIKIGLKYFTYLMETYNQNEYLSILAYNAGPGNVNKWLNDPFINNQELDVFIENIPFYETRTYIKKILASYWAYINCYSIKNKGN